MARVIDLFNIGEAIFWFVFAALAVFALRRRASWRRRLIFAAVVIIFGVSDLVEAKTGAWWRPWWLAAWKIVAAAAGIVVAWNLWKSHRSSEPVS